MWVWTQLPTPWTKPEPRGHLCLAQTYAKKKRRLQRVPSTMPHTLQNQQLMTLPVTTTWSNLWRRAHRGDVFVVGSDVIHQALHVLRQGHSAILWLRAGTPPDDTLFALQHKHRFIATWRPWTDTQLHAVPRKASMERSSTAGQAQACIPRMPAGVGAHLHRVITLGPFSGTQPGVAEARFKALRNSAALADAGWIAEWRPGRVPHSLPSAAPAVVVIEGSCELGQSPPALSEALAAGSIVLYRGAIVGKPWALYASVFSWFDDLTLESAAVQLAGYLNHDTLRDSGHIAMALCRNVTASALPQWHEWMLKAIGTLPASAPPCSSHFRCRRCRSANRRMGFLRETSNEAGAVQEIGL